MTEQDALLGATGLALGGITGSFLGCLVYRMPRGLSLLKPARSFCPACHRTIPWFRNVPVFGWLFLRGHCPDCGAKISVRYPLLEALAAGLFCLAALTFPPANAVVLCLLCALLLASAFIDLEHLLIPDRLTFPGTALGLICSALVPGLHGVTSWTAALIAALLGAGVGAGLLYAVSYFGKLAFGRFNVDSPEPIDFQVRIAEDGGREFVFAGEAYPWEELFFRKRDRIRIQAQNLQLNQSACTAQEVVLRRDSLTVGDRVIPLTEVTDLAGSTRQAQFPREAMGLGDVKLMAVIGAFLGWPGAIFSIAAGSLLGTVVGVTALALRRTQNTQIPFGPYLASGAILWAFTGSRLVAWYWRNLLS
ncbi:MAG: prepilin peptidase [Verrucomicrobia bacterium]|nr:prepilin peptidase [Verrucomicrobiota bacterium]